MPGDDLVQRFRRDLAALAGAGEARFGLAVSGGPDSVALLLLAADAVPGRIEAATVDHRLRPEAADEARFVAALCAERDIPHAILADPDRPAAGQAQARALRYRLLAGWARERGLSAIVTAHHRDDQAETVLMRLARGAGLAGLSGIRARREDEGVPVVRPLLGWSRDGLAAIVAEAGIAPVDDPSNRCEDYDRTRFRALLAGTDLLPAPRLAAAAAHLAEAEQALAWAAERAWRARAARDGGAILLDPANLPPELLRRLAARAIDEIGAGEWRRDGLARALAAAAEGRRTTLAGVQLTPGPRWRFEPAPPRRLAPSPPPPL